MISLQLRGYTSACLASVVLNIKHGSQEKEHKKHKSSKDKKKDHGDGAEERRSSHKKHKKHRSRSRSRSRSPPPTSTTELLQKLRATSAITQRPRAIDFF